MEGGVRPAFQAFERAPRGSRVHVLQVAAVLEASFKLGARNTLFLDVAQHEREPRRQGPIRRAALDMVANAELMEFAREDERFGIRAAEHGRGLARHGQEAGGVIRAAHGGQTEDN